MARRVTNNSGDWNSPQQYPARPNVHQQYGQQFAGPTPQMNAPPKTSADPWNWGWEDSNGGGESSNNNAQKDPTWDWSVESVSGGYKESGVPNNGANFGQPNNMHQMWSGGYHQQFPPSFPPQIPNTHDVISDSFNSLPVVNQHPYGHGQQALFNSMEGRNERRPQNIHVEYQDLFYNNNSQSGDQNQYHSNTNQSHSYFSGFHPPESGLGTQQIQNEGRGSLVGENRAPEEKSNAPFSVGGEFRGNAASEYIEAPRDVRNRSALHTPVAPDVLNRGESSSEALSPQWSTESLPSQGSDEISQATDTSNRQSDTSNTPGDVSSSQSITGGSGHESFEVSFRSDQEHIQSHRSSHVKQSGSSDNDGQTSYSSLPSNVHSGNEKSKDTSIPFFNAATQNLHRHSPIPSSSIQHSQGIQPSENPIEGAGVLFPTVEKVSSGVESINLNLPHPDVENVEVAPPENRSIPPVSGCIGAPPLSVSAGAPPLPPPVSSPPASVNRSIDKGANPYAAKGSSLNHKNANKNTGRARSLVPTPHINTEPSAENKKSIPPVVKANKVPAEGEVSQAGLSKSQAASSTAGSAFANSASPGRIPLPHVTEDSVNLETVPDNKERPDIDVQLDRKSTSPPSNLRFHQTPVGQDASASQPPLWPQESGLPDNQEVYLDNSTVFSLDSASHDNIPVDSDSVGRTSSWHRSPATNTNEVLCNPVHSELDRVVPGQGEENPPSNSSLLQQSFSGSTSNSNIEDIARRQVPGHQDTPPSILSGLHSGLLSAVEDISARAVPGGPVAGEVLIPTGAVSSLYMHRTVPGQTSEAHQLSLPNGADAPAALGEDDTPPPGLSRMVPGESRGPEGQGGDDATAENAPDEPRVVTGLAEDSRQTVGTSSTASSTFRPLPDEPRVVTGVAQDELDNSLASSDGHEITDLDADGQDSPAERAQLPSERSETIGSDCVEAFPAVSSDTVSRRESESQRRNTDDVDSNSVDLNRHGSSREYFSSMNSREREGPLDHSTESRRFRDDRDNRHYDRDDHLYDRDQDKSPRSRYSYNRERGRYDDQEYGQHRTYEESRQGRRYKHLDEDDDEEKEAYTSEGEQKRGKRDRERPPSDKSWYRDQEEFGRNYHRRHREPSDSHSRDFRGRERDQDRDADRERDRDRVRDRDRERDRDGDKDKERDRDRFYDRRYTHDRDYRRPDEYYAHYEDYYGQRSRPSSRSGSRPEFEDERRRDYHQYGGYYYNPRAMYDEYSYRYYMAWQRYMQQHPQYQHQQQQQTQATAHGSSMPEDRGSVHSGRSSTHDELSRHHMDRSADHNVSVLEETTTSTTPQRLTPAKFSTAHIKGIFSASGHFIKILPHYPLDGQSATVEVHDICHVLVPDAELTSFPGPLIKGVTHKKSLMNFCSRKINTAEHDPNLMERDSLVLLWRLLLLLLRQNGMVVGTDIAELLLSGSSVVEVPKSSNVNNTLPVSSTPSVRSVSPASISGAESEGTAATKPVGSKTPSEEELANTFREYLLYGNTHEALEWAMKYGLWGHALFLASKLGSRTYANVMTRFANGLTLNDPLQTLYQLMSGRLPAAVTCCADERWGDWKPHLAMILSNSSVQPDLEHRAIITLGDTLASRGCLYAAHFCYLMAQLEFGFYNQKASKLVLIGSSHTKPFSIFANNEAIQMTEIYIYACQLADPEFDVPQFQIYKLLYAKRLVEAGMPKEALQYVEVIARTISSRPTSYSIDFVQQVFDLGNRLKVHDVSYTPDSDGEAEELPWLLHLRNVLEDFMSGAIQPDGPSFGSTSNLSMSEGESAHPQFSSASLQQEVGLQQHQEQLHLEHQQFSQQQQQQISQQQQIPPPQETIEAENQASYGDTSQISTDPGVMNSAESGVPYNMQSGWNSQDYQREQNLLPEMRQDGETFWPRSNWDSGVSVENSNIVHPQQDTLQQNAHMGWEFQSNNVDRRDGGTAQDEQSVGNGFGYYPPHTSNKHSMERTSGEHRTPLVTNQPAHNVQSASVAKPKPKKETVKKAVPAPARNSWFGGLWNKLSLRPKNQMILPDDNEPKIVWNSEKQKWVNTDADDDENCGDLPPPPKMPEVPVAAPNVQSSSTSNGDIKMPPSSGQNMYKMNRSRGSRANYVDVFGGMKNAAPSVPAPEIFPSVGSSQPNPAPNFFVPAPVHSDDNTPVDFLTAAAEGGGGESSELSRWSSTSSISKEVQSYMAPQIEREARRQQRTQPTYGAPLMFNPSDVSQFAVPHNSASLPKNRYPN